MELRQSALERQLYRAVISLAKTMNSEIIDDDNPQDDDDPTARSGAMMKRRRLGLASAVPQLPAPRMAIFGI